MSKKKNKTDTIPARETVGKMLADTQEQHQKQDVEVGEFVEEVGSKELMPEIWRQIDARRGLPQWRDKYYILVLFRKDTVLNRAIRIYVQSRHTKPLMEPGLTCYSYDPNGDLLVLEWVLPNKSAFMTFLKTREYSDEFLMNCIDRYMAGER